MSATSQLTQRKAASKAESPGKDRKNAVEDKKPDAPVTGTEPPKNKWKSMMTRVMTGACLIGAFAWILARDRIWVCLFIVILQALTFREMVAVRYQQAKERKLWYFRTLNWYFLFITLFHYYGKNVLIYFRDNMPANVYDYLHHHYNWFSFIFYCAGFVAFIASLRKNTLKYQITQMAWTITTLLVVVVQAHFTFAMIFEGLIWFVFPTTLIVFNDIAAYFMGFAFGKKLINRPLLKLSPNKTWEGFVGAAFWTVVVGYYGAGALSQYHWLTCPGTYPTECATPLYFQRTEIYFPGPVQAILQSVGIQWESINAVPFQLHGIVFALFASLIAPFGGFLASAIKRAHKIKDFDSVLPGHGGVTDRMDCQFIMSLFVFVYYTTFIKPPAFDADEIFTLIQYNLGVDQQLHLYSRLSQALKHHMK